MLAINPQKATIFAEHPAAALVFKRHLAYGKTTGAMLIYLINCKPHTRYLGVGKHNCKGALLLPAITSG